MTTINGRPFDDLSKLQQWLVVVMLAKDAPSIDEDICEIDAVAITVNGHPCDLTYLAERLHEQLEAARQLGRRDEREYIRNTLKSSAYLWVDQVMRTLSAITDDINWLGGSLLEVDS